MRTGATPTGTNVMGSRPVVRRALAAAVAVSTCAGAATAVVPASATAAAAPAAALQTEQASDLTMVQANIYTRLSVDRFQADVREVLAQDGGPDFVTYNEVPFRKDGVLAPQGYAIYRKMRNRFTAETPVVWRTDRWTMIDHGTRMISDWRGKPPGRVVEIGRRYANWVTLRGVDDRVLSVVSIHVAPLDDGMPDLLRRSVRRLGDLVDQLAPRGPVLVGGDFNVHYKSRRYPRDILSAHHLVPTYDTLGTYFPTGDHRGATIDYLFDRGVKTLRVDKHRPVELYSDHDAVVGGFSWQTDAPVTTRTVTNDPDGDSAGQRAVLTAVVDGIRGAAPGSALELATRRLSLSAVTRALKRALDRGVHVRVVTASGRPTIRERRLARAIAGHGDRSSWLRRCVDSCRDGWADAGVPRSLVLVGRPDGSWQTRYDANRSLTRTLIHRASRVRISTGQSALEEGEQLFDAVAQP